jgi:hypothetical protein
MARGGDEHLREMGVLNDADTHTPALSTERDDDEQRRRNALRLRADTELLRRGQGRWTASLRAYANGIGRQEVK